MNCQQVKEWLTQKPDSPNPMLTNHLASCEACARMAEAADLLKNSLSSVVDIGEPPSLAEFRMRVSTGAAQMNRWSRIMSRMKVKVLNNRRFVFPAAAVVAVCLFISLVPLPHSEVIGYEIELAGVSAEQAANPDLLEAAFVKAGYESVKVDRTTDNGQTVYRLENVPRRTDANTMAATVTMLSGGVVMPRVTAIAAKGRATLLAQATWRDKEEEDKRPIRIELKDGKFCVDLDLDNGEVLTNTQSNSELRTRVAEILESIGIENGVGVATQTDDTNSSKATVMIIITSDALSDSLLENFEFEVDSHGCRKVVGSLTSDGSPDSTRGYLFIDYVEGDDDNNAVIIIKAPYKK